MTAITAAVRTRHRSLAAIVAIAFAVVALILFVTSPAHGLHHVASAYHHLPHFLQAFLGAQHFGS